MTTVDHLFAGRTRLDEREIGFVLKLTSYADLAWFLGGPPRAGDERDAMVNRLFRELAQFDGARLGLDKARTLVDLPTVVSDVLTARNRLHEEGRDRGLLFARCPTCSTDTEISLVSLVLRLRTAPPALTTNAGQWLAPPAIAVPNKLVRGMRRGDLPLASQIRFELPSSRLGLGAPTRPRSGVFAVLDEAREESAWATLWPKNIKTPPEHAWWHTNSLPFRALVRLCAATASLDRGTPTPANLETLPAIDVEFLDAAVIATQLTNEPPDDVAAPGLVPRPRNLPVTCEQCRTQYLPLL